MRQDDIPCRSFLYKENHRQCVCRSYLHIERIFSEWHIGHSLRIHFETVQKNAPTILYGSCCDKLEFILLCVGTGLPDGPQQNRISMSRFCFKSGWKWNIFARRGQKYFRTVEDAGPYIWCDKQEFISLTLINSMQNSKCKMQNECVAKGDYYKLFS